MTRRRTPPPSDARRGSASKAKTPALKRNALGLTVDEETSARLGRVRQTGTTPELAVRRVLTELGARYTTSNRDLPGSPDLANRRRRWAVFVHGCYWHRHEGCRRTTTPSRNREFWVAKFAANQARDARALEALTQLGYQVLVIWECESERVDELRERLLTLSSRADIKPRLRPRPRPRPRR